MDRAFLESLGLDAETADAVMQAHEKTVEDHQAQLSALQLQHAVSDAVHRAGGRSVKAITALLDMDTIGKAEDIPGALDKALTTLKKDSSYLFEQPAPPPYARFTGSGDGAAFTPPATLAGALRERMARK